MSKSPGMLMSNINSQRAVNKVMKELDEVTDEMNMDIEPDIKSKMKAMEFKVNRGLSGN